MSRKLFLLGAGVTYPGHLTNETVSKLEEADVIFSNIPEDRLAELPSTLPDKTISVWPLYVDGRKRQENYQRVVTAIHEKMEGFNRVAWLTRGNPVIFDSVTSALSEVARKDGWDVEIFPAVSSIDTLLVDVEFEPAGGLLICEATALVTGHVQINPLFAAMILQPGAFLTPEARLGQSYKQINLSPLAEHLQKFYPSNHPCAFVISSHSQGLSKCVTWSSLDAFPTVDQNLIRGSTMFVPPVARA